MDYRVALDAGLVTDFITGSGHAGNRGASSPSHFIQQVGVVVQRMEFSSPKGVYKFRGVDK